MKKLLFFFLLLFSCPLYLHAVSEIKICESGEFSQFFILSISPDQKYIAGVLHVGKDYSKKNGSYKISLNTLEVKSGKTKQQAISIPLTSNATQELDYFVVIDTERKKVIKQEVLPQETGYEDLINRERMLHGNMQDMPNSEQLYNEYQTKYGKTMEKGVDSFYQDLFKRYRDMVGWLKEYNMEFKLIRGKGDEPAFDIAEKLKLKHKIEQSQTYIGGNIQTYIIAEKYNKEYFLGQVTFMRKESSQVILFQTLENNPPKVIIQLMSFFLDSCHDKVDSSLWIIKP